MANALANLARVYTNSVGTGDIQLGPPVQGFVSYSQARLADGEVVSYGIQVTYGDGGMLLHSETGTAVYNEGTNSLTNRTCVTSTNNNNPLSLPGPNPTYITQVFITALASDIANYFAGISELKNSGPYTDGAAYYVIGSSVRGQVEGGLFQYRTSDLSSLFVRETISVSSGEINTGTGVITKIAHGLRTAYGCVVSGGDGLLPNNLYYIRVLSDDTFALYPTYADAIAGTNRLSITGTTAFNIDILVDPDQVVFISLAGAALNGTDGGFVRLAIEETNVWQVSWFPGSGPDDTDQVNKAILAANIDAHLGFPADTFVISPRTGRSVNIGIYQLPGQKWVGSGRENGTTIQLSASVPIISYVILQEANSEYGSISDMCFDGNRQNITPTSGDLYNTFFLIVGSSNGKYMRYERLLLKNSWGRALQTGLEQGTECTNILVNDVIALNIGSKAISATLANGVVIQNCYVECVPYTSSENPAGTAATSASCYESNASTNVVIQNNIGKQLGTQSAPGIRTVNGNRHIKVIANTIYEASYLGFITGSDIIFYGNTGINIRGNAFLVTNDDVAVTDTLRVYIENNTIIDPTNAYVLITASAPGDAYVQVFITLNNFVKTSLGSPAYGIYNFGVVAPATGGSCLVYQWNNNFAGSIPNQLSGPAANQIQNEPNQSEVGGNANRSLSNLSSVAINTALLPAANDGSALGSGAFSFSDLFLANGGVVNWNNGNATLTHSAGLLTSSVPITARTATNDPLRSVNTSDIAAARVLRLEGDRATPTNNDQIVAGWYLSNSAGTQVEIFRQTARATNVSAGSETTLMDFQLCNAGSLGSVFVLTPGILRPAANDGTALGAATISWSDLFLASGGVINWANGNAVITHSTGVLDVTTGDLRVSNPGSDNASVVTNAGAQTLTNKISVDVGTAGYLVSGIKVVGAQEAAVADAAGGSTVDTEARAAINTLLARLRSHGLIGT